MREEVEVEGEAINHGKKEKGSSREQRRERGAAVWASGAALVFWFRED